MNSRVAFVTGAARGLGAEIARALFEAGARVVLTDVDASVRQTALSLDPAGERTMGWCLDVRDEAAFTAAFDAAIAHFGAVDVMVNNAAITAGGSLWSITSAEWDSLMAVNLRGTFLGCRIAGAHMRERGAGRIVNLSSFAGQHASAASGLHYAASKAGILAVTRGFAMELAPHGVTVNAIAPSAIDGPQWRAVPAQRREALLATVPLGRAGRADEVSAAVLYLASPAAAYVNGITLDINGGRAMR